jgi:ubiquitin-activating enzyme E1
VPVPAFKPSGGVKIETDPKATANASAALDDVSVLENLCGQLEGILADLPDDQKHLVHIPFEKDDDNNFHMDVIAGLANLRYVIFFFS